MQDFILNLNQALNKGDIIVFSSRCEINYSGRAKSYLPEGDRLFIIKPDKTLIIHQPEGSAPVNYMKNKTEYNVFEENGDIWIKSTKGKEYRTQEIFNLN